MPVAFPPEDFKSAVEHRIGLIVGSDIGRSSWKYIATTAGKKIMAKDTKKNAASHGYFNKFRD